MNNTLKQMGRFVPFALLLSGVLFAVPSNSNKAKAQDSGAETFEVDATHSSVLFKVKHKETAYYYGKFIDVNGTISFNRSSPNNSSVSLTVPADSVRTWNKKRDNHLKGDDFLNVEQHPKIKFESKSVSSTGDNQYKLTGDFTLHGVTKEITITAEKTGEKKTGDGHIIGFHTKFSINRSDYGMDKMLGAVGDKVTLIISIEAGKK